MIIKVRAATDFTFAIDTTDTDFTIITKQVEEEAIKQFTLAVRKGRPGVLHMAMDITKDAGYGDDEPL